MKNTQFWVVQTDDFNNFYGDLDLYLLDLILKGRIEDSAKILDAGCGTGRNLLYFLNSGFEVSSVDVDQSNVTITNLLSRAITGKDVCVKGDLMTLPFDDYQFDFVLCARVLHFSNSDEEFWKMLSELRRVLSRSGFLYLTIDSLLGLESECQLVSDGKYLLPDGNLRFLLTEDVLRRLEETWDHDELVRTVLFGKQHAETTLVLKPKSGS